VAPIEEDMLLGLDFLEANGVSLHLKEKELKIAGEVIPISLGTGSPLVNEKETGVFLAKECKVPPNSVMRVGAQLSESMANTPLLHRPILPPFPILHSDQIG
jgi:hypothetical protein